MKDDAATIAELTRAATMARFRLLAIEGEEHEDELSWQRATCHLHRQEVERAAVPLIYTIGALSFSDARARESSDVEYQEHEAWLFADLLTRLRLERDKLVFDADYVRGRMMKKHRDPFGRDVHHRDTQPVRNAAPLARCVEGTKVHPPGDREG